MIRINPHYPKLQASYLFADIARRVSAFQQQHPDKHLIRLGIGDVTQPLPPACIAALHQATDEMANAASFRGYGPEQGYDFLREAIATHDFQARGAQIEADEIFVSDGAKSDTGNIQEIFAQDVRVAIPDPVYPVYVDTNVMAGRTAAAVDGRYPGFVYLDSRIKRLIIRHDGFKVFPSMIENVVSQHPAVHQCSVVGCVDKDHVQGRLPFVYLVLDPAVPAAKRKQIIKELRQLCIEELPEYVQPVGYKIIPEMPLTLAAKFDYRKLEEEITPRDY